jgi:ferredoxin
MPNLGVRGDERGYVMEAVRHKVAYLSPSGTTRRVAETIGEALRARGAVVETLDLGKATRGGPMGVSGAGPTCVWVGSPVYVHHPLPQVLQFVEGLPVLRRGFGVPFVTWGAATSGLALWDLGLALEARGYRVLGAAKVLAVHSTFWNVPDPLGAGHPDAEDLSRVEALVDGVLGKLAAGARPLDAASLDYQPPSMRAISEESSLERAKARMAPLRLDEGRCSACGACREACPAGAVELAPYPIFGPECIRCGRCVQACPEGALPFDPAPLQAHIRAMAAKYGEEPATRVLL